MHTLTCMKNSCYWVLTSVHQIIQMLKNAGFSHVIAEDRTDQVCPSFCAVRTPMLFSTRTFGSKSGFDDTHQCSVLHSSSSGFYRRSWINLKRTKTVSFLTSARWFGKGLRKFRDELAGSLEACLHSLCSFQLLSISNSELSPQKKKNSDLFVHSRFRGTDDIVNGWKAKLQRSSAGEQRWGLFIASKWCWPRGPCGLYYK